MATLTHLKIQGYKPFQDLNASPGALEVMVGANGSGKTSLFEFLRFLRDSMSQEIPPEIVEGGIGQQVFHKPGPDKLAWELDYDLIAPDPVLVYRGALLGPVGKVKITEEQVHILPTDQSVAVDLLKFDLTEGVIRERRAEYRSQEIQLTKRANQLALAAVITPENQRLYQLRDLIRGWRFYSAYRLDGEKIRKSAVLEQEPQLRENAGNLSSVLHYLLTEYPAQFDTLCQMIGLAVPGFVNLTVKARGGPGEVMAFWQEKGVQGELSLVDLSDGIQRLLCWMVLCIKPNPPSLICIDEPDQGVHPRTLPILAGLFEKASSRTQIFLATHSSYFLSQFDLQQIAVFRKENGEARFLKPANSKSLVQNLADFGSSELEAMHRSDELESLA